MDAIDIWGESNVRTTVAAVAFEGERELDARHLRNRYFAGTGCKVRRLVETYIRDTCIGDAVTGQVSQDFVATFEGANVPGEDENVS